jgi:hypothetical protein
VAQECAGRLTHQLNANHQKRVASICLGSRGADWGAAFGHNRSFDTNARIVDNLEHTIGDDICLPSIYRIRQP